ncbi:PREDICTED: uncharacterized protein LOC101295168 isoform X2 [Fragaria vesca subsp. vesca]|uniref:uncharacterized protein LOC101295168 isoform X2 n=1 Tax=Fragaria vesca subsp. vesca TaxID=101020 RepID=UPI0002C3164A|nr:PREDICTED: uncharacterized protein LOC101295168 isoform X2 [Fragaria vesca subsp. vesca]
MVNLAAMFGSRRRRAPKSPAIVEKKDTRGGSKVRGSKYSHGSGAGRPNNTSARRSWKKDTKSEERKIAPSPPPSNEGASSSIRFFRIVGDTSKDSKHETSTLAKESKINTDDDSSSCSSDLDVDALNERCYQELREFLSDLDPYDGKEVVHSSPQKWIPLDSRFDLSNLRRSRFPDGIC